MTALPPTKTLLRRLDESVPAVLDLMEVDGDYQITRVNVPRPHRGQGHGSALLREACAWADAHGVTLNLGVSPYPDSPLQHTALTEWYGRYGLLPRPGGPPLLWRAPHGPAGAG